MKKMDDDWGYPHDLGNLMKPPYIVFKKNTQSTTGGVELCSILSYVRSRIISILKTGAIHHGEGFATHLPKIWPTSTPTMTLFGSFNQKSKTYYDFVAFDACNSTLSDKCALHSHFLHMGCPTLNPRANQTMTEMQITGHVWS